MNNNPLQLTITIHIYKHIKLFLDLMDWYVWPVWGYDQAAFGAKQIEIAWNPRTTEPPRTRFVARKYRHEFHVHFLLFKLRCLVWRTNADVANIFPAGYDWRKDPDFDSKHQQLVETGYFA